MNLKKAIVVGGGFAGLIAARVLSDRFEEIQVIERDSDSIVGAFNPRNGVPQGTQFHVLNSKGSEILSELFPGLEQLLIDHGSYRIDTTLDVFHYQYGFKPLVKSGACVYLHTRPLLEECIRAQFIHIPNVKFLYDAEAVGLLTHFKEKRITGVRIFHKGCHKEENLYADLIIDASGRSTHCPEWLEALGYGMLPSSELRINMRYVGRIYRWPDTFNPPWKGLLIKGEDKKSGFMLRIEDDAKGKRVMVTLSAQHEPFPVTPEGFLSFAKQLDKPTIYELIKDFEPLGPPLPFDIPTIRRFHYERHSKLPNCLIAMGDAVSTFSPNYGVGMSSCVLAGAALQQALKYPLDQVARRYYKIVTPLLNDIWNRTVTDTSFESSFSNWYFRWVLKLCNEDAELWKEVHAYLCFEKNRWVWFRPNIFTRVLMHAVKNSLS